MSEFQFDEAIAFYRSKVRLPTAGWTDLWQEQHSHAFVVAGANHDAIVEDFFNAVQNAKWAKDGGGYEGFRTSFDEIVKKHGWAHNGSAGWRSRIIYDTNITQAYNAGRYQQQQDIKEFRPYGRYRHVNCAHPRLNHLAWDGIILPIDDPWFDTHYPQNGWRCHCRVDSLNHTEAQQLWQAKGKTGVDTAPPIEWEKRWVGKKSANPRLVDTPKGIDPGFAYNPGKAWHEPPKGMPAVEKYRADKAALLAAKDAKPVANFMGLRPGVQDLPPVKVTELTGKEFGENLSKKELAQAADLLLRTLQKGDGLVNEDTGLTFKLNQKSRKKMGDNADLKAAESKAIASIESLVRNAVLTEIHPDDEHRNPDVRAVFRLYVPVNMAGVLLRVKLTVKDYLLSGSPKLLHALSAIEIENAPLGTLPSYSSTEVLQTTQPTTGRTITITELLKNAILNDGTPIIPK